jgi:hypothetical protein
MTTGRHTAAPPYIGIAASPNRYPLHDRTAVHRCNCTAGQPSGHPSRSRLAVPTPLYPADSPTPGQREPSASRRPAMTAA